MSKTKKLSVEMSKVNCACMVLQVNFNLTAKEEVDPRKLALDVLKQSLTKIKEI